MNDSHINSIARVEEIINGLREMTFVGLRREEKYAWIEQTLNKFGYFSLRKREKAIVKRYLISMTGYKDAQITRLIGKKKKMGKVLASKTKHHTFSRIYTPDDIAALIETDNAHGRLSGKATKRIFERMFSLFKDMKFSRLKNISVSHIYNLRDLRQYKSWARVFEKTKPTQVPIGERRKPDPQGMPGYLRIDTVHQGDLDKEKGVYHINVVDEALQWEIVGCVEKISEAYLEPLLIELLEQFPFKIINFHSDNGSEYINKIVAKLVNKLLIKQTKSRARHCNDNALCEGKNGSIIRKQMGYVHIPQRFAKSINAFYREHLNPYLNFHRPCGFATIIIDTRGKEKKVYNVYQTPFEALLGHPRASEFLKEGVGLEDLRMLANKKSDNECAAQLQKAKVELFRSFRQNLKLPTSYALSVSGS